MSNEKRQILCILLIFVWVLAASRWLGLMQPTPPPKKPAAATDARKDTKKAEEAQGKNQVAGKEASTPEAAALQAAGGSNAAQAAAALVDPRDLILGSATDKEPDGYRLEVRLEQKGAGVESVFSSRYDAEFEGRRNLHLPLELIRRDPVVPPSLAMTLSHDPADRPAAASAEAPAEPAEKPSSPPEDLLDSVVWEVELHDGKPVVPITGEDPTSHKPLEGQQVVFKARSDGGVLITKTYRLWKGIDGLELELRFDSPDRERTFSYNILGPHGLPIEGEWYTQTFREVFFGTNDSGKIKVESHMASEIAKATDKPFDSTALPLRFAGVENQYFTSFLAPFPAPMSDQDRIDRETRAVLLHKDPTAPQKSDVTVRLSSKPLHVGPNRSEVHTYRIFAGPKTEEALTPYNAVTLATYRKGWIPGASWVAHYFISPTLSMTYKVTEWVGRLFGGTRGNWGIAIVLLTLLVKLVMFPLGRKQALMAQRSQQIQPLLKEIQEKYKDDKEKQTRETLALMNKHGVNPVSGCIPALIQLPIFVGLWQALNTSVALRHSPFLWISDLAAPDMLFRLPFEVPWLGWQWFNLLPIVVVALMLFQTKLFAPPATTPEAEQQQKVMQIMMVMMAVMFYKVPSGLGIYFITSSLWSIGERLLLPKITHAPALVVGGSAEPGKDSGGRGKSGPGGRPGPGENGPAAPKKPPGAFSQFMERILDEARKDPTYRKMVEQREGNEGTADKKSEGDGRRDRGKPRARPGRK
jgi:YidC/Oxa1 family membrane protein insertase